MAHFEQRRFIVDGKPRIVLSGEIHYFRLQRKDWIDRIQKAKRAGCNAIASYIPWVYHQEVEDQLDLKTKERDLGTFIDICKEYDLWFIARPGPFTMGEMINEGIPDWIYTKHPEAIPTTWGGKKVTSKTLNYLHDGFLEEVEKW
ncbi:MAG TPA: beta-galactosidase, partial [Fimbriimonas sp.]|nr:beta-galactosidase [Fimbriimonas sp.]